MRSPASTQTRNYLLIIAALILVVTAISLYANLQKVDTQYRQLAAVVARSYSQAIGGMREWNNQHGGVYVPVTGNFRPNPLLKDPLREVTTREGLRLTKVNHAHMVRLLSNLLTEEREIRVRITSATPVQAANAPTDWEKSALDEFVKGKKEVFGVSGAPDRPVFRFMVPLKVEPSCLRCHPEHKGRPEDIRGGVSVSFSFTPFLRLMGQNNRQIWTVHLLFLAVALLLIFLLGRKLVLQIDALQDSLEQIRKLEGLVPICANCKKIRTEGANPFDQKSWTSIEKYISDRTDAEFTHGLCPDCAKRLYPGVEGGTVNPKGP
jgi:two-component system NtrC family sensor kinase